MGTTDWSFSTPEKGSWKCEKCSSQLAEVRAGKANDLSRRLCAGRVADAEEEGGTGRRQVHERPSTRETGFQLNLGCYVSLRVYLMYTASQASLLSLLATTPPGRCFPER